MPSPTPQIAMSVEEGQENQGVAADAAALPGSAPSPAVSAVPAAATNAFTPGPWKSEQQPGDEWWFGGRNGCQHVIYAGDKSYNSHAVIGGEYGDLEAEANARLMAAAPDGYAANVLIVDALAVEYWLPDDADDDYIYDTLGSGLSSAYFAARAAIAKARGQ